MKKFFQKTLIAHFLTTINFKIALKSSSFLFFPWKWGKFYEGKSVKNLEKKLLKFLDLANSEIISFYNGRSAIFHGIKLLGIKEGDEILTQAFSCVSVSNSIIQTGANPIYCDVDSSLNISFEEIKNKFSEKTKAILVQNTFGNPANLEEIKKFCEEKNIFLIEDCAHSLGAEFGGKKVGSFGDISIFSFGRDKVISSINGGFLVVNDEKLKEIDYLKNFLAPTVGAQRVLERKNFGNNQLKNLKLKELLKNLFYIILSFKAKIFYDFFGLGKFILFIGRKLKILPDVLSCNEKICKENNLFYKYPNCLAEIGEMEFDKNLEKFNSHRIKIFELYKKNLKKFEDEGKIFFASENFLEGNGKNISQNISLRIPLFITEKSKNSAKEILKLGRKEKIIFGDRYRNVIDPIGTSFENAKYEKGSCKNAEKLAEKVMNLPNHFGIKEKDCERICGFLRKSL